MIRYPSTMKLVPESRAESMRPHENVTPKILSDELEQLIAKGVIQADAATIPLAMVRTQLEKGVEAVLDPYMTRALRMEIVRAARGKMIDLAPYLDL